MMQNQYTNIGGVESLWVTHTVGNGSGIASVRWYQIPGDRWNGADDRADPVGHVEPERHAPLDAEPGREQERRHGGGIQRLEQQPVPGDPLRGSARHRSPGHARFDRDVAHRRAPASQCCTFSSGSTNNRWGDYSAMTIDPDGCTFWYTSEFYESPQPTTLATDNWKTRIGSFKYSTCTPLASLVPDGLAPTATNAPATTAANVR